MTNRSTWECRRCGKKFDHRGNAATHCNRKRACVPRGVDDSVSAVPVLTHHADGTPAAPAHTQHDVLLRPVGEECLSHVSVDFWQQALSLGASSAWRMAAVIAQVVWFNPSALGNMGLAVVDDTQAFWLRRDSVDGALTWHSTTTLGALTNLLTVQVPRLLSDHVARGAMPPEVARWVRACGTVSTGADAHMQSLLPQASLCAALAAAVTVVPGLPEAAAALREAPTSQRAGASAAAAAALSRRHERDTRGGTVAAQPVQATPAPRTLDEIAADLGADTAGQPNVFGRRLLAACAARLASEKQRDACSHS